jgi:hypothetical protein
MPEDVLNHHEFYTLGFTFYQTQVQRHRAQRKEDVYF